MGKGVALVYKLKYPDMYNVYKEYCKKHLIDIGKLWLYKGTDHWVLNFPTKYDWMNPSKIEYLEKGLQKFVETYKDKRITSIAFPMLGTNNGGLDKPTVLKLMKYYLSKCEIPVEIYNYDPLKY
jgi:O-acetyl-ADP-ribose deacetylase (regulator of RNase III)